MHVLETAVSDVLYGLRLPTWVHFLIVLSTYHLVRNKNLVLHFNEHPSDRVELQKRENGLASLSLENLITEKNKLVAVITCTSNEIPAPISHLR